ncbi:ribosome silencing factor [Anaerovibrio sp.]|uniref:ribosome silencing factor n=1 Tax=Anaerovibrio sp. TaxID=1872532 RepID=UPI003F1617D5
MVKTSLDLAKLIADAASDKKARDIVLMNMDGLTPATDYFVVCSAGSTTQVRAIADSIEDKLQEDEGIEFMHKEGYREGEWVLMDYGDCVAHIFLQDSREYYSLETLWGDAELTAYEG